ncbi:MAG: hypothetical protein M3466_16345 [Gemmatimonadota bacterium]|nr:hypothetical protein [Gemmatimonadota bacterium]
MSEESIHLTLTYDEALVLFDFFARFQDTDLLRFAHVAEFLALERIPRRLIRAL